jgi:hypothetical protein
MWNIFSKEVGKTRQTYGCCSSCRGEKRPAEFNAFLKKNAAGKDLVKSIEKLAHE